jgi:ABC-type antimicrobial peptide transport system permease subunit
MTAQIERAARTLDPTLSLDFTLLSAQVRNSLRQERLMAQLSSIFTLVALLLAAIGIYGVAAYAVTRRTNEIGVRMALGAQRADVTQMVLREALLVAAAGIALGLPAAFAASRLIKTLLFGVGPADPLLIFLTVAVMCAVALLASYLPARRASRIDPMVALRYE